MQVTVEATQGLERRMTVTIADHDIAEKVEERLRSIAKTTRMSGFRPGKAPYKLVARQYREQVTSEVMEGVARATFGKALEQESVQPASEPKLHSQNLKDDNVFEYVVMFEAYPKVNIKNIDKIKVEHPVVEISDADVDKMIEMLRQQRVRWAKVERGAQKGDRMQIDFEAKIDGKSLNDGAAKDRYIILGDGFMVSAFEDNLLELKRGDEKVFDVDFDEKDAIEEFAGKTVEFTVKVGIVEEPVLPAVDEKFMQVFGVKEGDMEKFRDEIHNNMQHELDGAVRADVKSQIMTGLLEENKFDVPKALLDEEVEQVKNNLASQNAQAAPSVDLVEQARRRVALGIMFSELVVLHDILIDNDTVEAKIQNIASSYEQPDAIARMYHETPQLKRHLESQLIEDRVIDTLMQQVDVHDAQKSFYDVVSHSRLNYRF